MLATKRPTATTNSRPPNSGRPPVRANWPASPSTTATRPQNSRHLLADASGWPVADGVPSVRRGLKRETALLAHLDGIDPGPSGVGLLGIDEL